MQNEAVEQIVRQVVECLKPELHQIGEISKTIDELKATVLSLEQAELENGILEESISFEGEDGMPRIKKRVSINGVDQWVTANNEQELYQRIIDKARVATVSTSASGEVKQPVTFEEYATNWLELEKRPTTAPTTFAHYRVKLSGILIPYFGSRQMCEIKAPDIISYFATRKNMSQNTVMSEKKILRMIFAAALEDGAISKNPMLSRRVKPSAKLSSHRPVIDTERFTRSLEMIGNIQRDGERNYFAILAVHAMRPEEVRGLQWKDIDLDTCSIFIRQAVTYPDRNRATIGEPKTEASKAKIGLVREIIPYLTPGRADEYITGGDNPWSYTQGRRAWGRIRKAVGLEGVTEAQFRTTIATLLYSETHDAKAVQSQLRHATPAQTMAVYVKPTTCETEMAEVIGGALFPRPDVTCHVTA